MDGIRYLCTDELPGEFSIQGQTVAVEKNVFVHDALYPVTKEDEQLYLFDPHPVNENRTHGLENDINNLARLFQCDTFPSLASFLLSNAALDGSVRHSAIKPKNFGRSKKMKHGRPKILKTTREEQVREANKRYSQQNPETNRDAVRRYTENHPEVNRAAVRRYED
ncbi:hypothetical protein J6590_062873 [Homalodisca vitripennis]|nr:hypothetical protein J6590_062873 [Homalodisca vitripennis]